MTKPPLRVKQPLLESRRQQQEEEEARQGVHTRAHINQCSVSLRMAGQLAWMIKPCEEMLSKGQSVRMFDNHVMTCCFHNTVH